jgi:hypothetical protein
METSLTGTPRFDILRLYLRIPLSWWHPFSWLTLATPNSKYTTQRLVWTPCRSRLSPRLYGERLLLPVIHGMAYRSELFEHHPGNATHKPLQVSTGRPCCIYHATGKRVLGAPDNVGGQTPAERKMSEFPMETPTATMLITSVERFLLSQGANGRCGCSKRQVQRS